MRQFTASNGLPAAQPPNFAGYSALAWTALVVSAAAVGAHYLPGNLRWLVYLTKPGATLLILAIALGNSLGGGGRYGWAIVLGLAFSTLGDIFLMLPGDRFLAGLSSFALAHVCYLIAFTMSVRFAARLMPFLGYFVVAGAVLCFLWRDIPAPLRAPVIVYVLLLASMASQAAVRAQVIHGRSLRLAAVGGCFFLLSDALLAVNRFGHRFWLSSLCVLGTYYAGQFLIALSTAPATATENPPDG